MLCFIDLVLLEGVVKDPFFLFAKKFSLVLLKIVVILLSLGGNPDRKLITQLCLLVHSEQGNDELAQRKP